MLGFLERRIAYFNDVRANWRAQREARVRLAQSLRTAQIRLCPGCQVPIEKNEGCDHMHCAFCGLHFSWRQAVPCNIAALENTGDGRFRFCPHCNYQNEKLHSLAMAKCARCQKDFDWDSALFVPLVIMPAPPVSHSRRNSAPVADECGRAREPPPVITAAVQAWLDDPRRPRIDPEADHANDNEEIPIVENLRCEICVTRQKTFALQCGHLFCEHCLVQVLRNQPLCPVDRVHVTVAPIRIFI